MCVVAELIRCVELAISRLCGERELKNTKKLRCKGLIKSLDCLLAKFIGECCLPRRASKPRIVHVKEGGLCQGR